MTNLQRIRLQRGLSQSKLAKASGVKLRSIQHWEQGDRNINKAAVDTVVSMANVLGCTVVDLMEKQD